MQQLHKPLDIYGLKLHTTIKGLFKKIKKIDSKIFSVLVIS